MPELRRNPITGHWVILAENRGERPQEISLAQSINREFHCPFCEGHEHRTPPETLAQRATGSQPDGPGWQVRVVPNKFAAVGDISSNYAVARPPHPDLLSARDSDDQLKGLHEVIVESPHHLASVTELIDDQFAAVLETYRQRLATIRGTGQFREVTIFKNSGTLGGATLSHVHSQLVALVRSTVLLSTRLQNFQQCCAASGKCPGCEMAAQEENSSANESHIVAGSAEFVAVCPAAPRFAYETWILPRRHAPYYDQINRESLPQLARLFRQVLVKLERIIKLPAYNYIVHTAPFDTFGSDHYHWHIEILPRITTLGGLEIGTGCYINSVPPKRAAKELREA